MTVLRHLGKTAVCRNPFRAISVALASASSLKKTGGEDGNEKNWFPWMSMGGVATLTTAAWYWNQNTSHGDMASFTEVVGNGVSFLKELKDFSFVSLETRKRSFFKYEKRIRSLSTPEKVFAYFSSIEDNKITFMNATDLLRALVPVYPPEGSPVERSGFLSGERKPTKETCQVFQWFDINGDNQISFHEFLILLTFLSIPLKDIDIIFQVVDFDKNGVIDREEFEKVLNHLKRQCAHVQRSRGGVRSGLYTGQSDQTSLLTKFFGENCDEHLHLEKFKKFLHEIHNKVWQMEFQHYDYYQRNRITAKDFARSMCAGVSVANVDYYLDRTQSMNHRLSTYQFNLQDFLSYHSLVHHIPALNIALHFYDELHGPPSYEEFAALIHRLIGQKLSAPILELIFYIFGDNNGKLQTTRFLDVLQSRVRDIMFNTEDTLL